ncbi:hypothetical protein QMM87_15625 [Leptospira santarosai]|uniref:hypothetical protein n=1 Tax=Leptospira santarosai TaxID=28183 RepID=UPI0024AF3047|nr:hypothetical protein [Leptospira santarosai]MDI7230079.1 hypothetical protein [Leptospira santarosai]
MIKDKNYPIATDNIEENENGSIDALNKNSDIINVLPKDDRLTLRVNWNDGYNSEFWVSEVEVHTSMDNVILTENFIPGKRLNSNGVEVLFDSERLFLKYHYDSFQKSLRGNSIQNGLTDILLDRGIIVNNWDNFEKDRIAFNQKVKLETEDLFNLKANLKYLLSDCHIDIDEKGRFFFEKAEWRLEIDFLRIDSDEIVHIKYILLDNDLCNIAFDCGESNDAEIYNIPPDVVTNSIEWNLDSILEKCKIVDITAGWFKTLESISKLEFKESICDIQHSFFLSRVRTPGSKGIEINNMYENYYDHPLFTYFDSTINLLKAIKSAQGNLLLAIEYLEGKENLIQRIKDKFKISKLQESELLLISK